MAKLAQLPKSVIARAQEVLQVLTTTEERQSEAIAGSLGSSRKSKKVTKSESHDNEILDAAYEQLQRENVQLKASADQLKQQLRQYEKRLGSLK